MWVYKASPAFAVAAVMFLGSCVNRLYRVEMSTEGHEVRRTISAFRLKDGEWEPAGFRREDASRIARAYALAGGRFQSATGRFVSVPEDLGGAGFYEHWPTRLGDAYNYVERLPGEMNLWGAVRELEVVSDRLADELIDWLSTALAGEPGLPELQRFLDDRLRLDLRNFALQVRQLGGPTVTMDEEEAILSMWIRGYEYLVEAGYCAPADFPVVWQGLGVVGATPRLQELLLRTISDRMGIARDEPLPPAVLRLADPSYEHSCERWMDSYGELEDNPFVSYLTWFGFDFDFSGSLKVETALRAEREPIMANGEWDAGNGRMEWAARSVDPDQIPPLLRYALWSEPDEAFQNEHFGSVVIEGKELWLYALWLHGLPTPLAAEWDEFLEGVRPGDDLIQEIHSFRFSEGDASGSIAQSVYELFGDAAQ